MFTDHPSELMQIKVRDTKTESEHQALYKLVLEADGISFPILYPNKLLAKELFHRYVIQWSNAAPKQDFSLTITVVEGKPLKSSTYKEKISIKLEVALLAAGITPDEAKNVTYVTWYTATLDDVAIKNIYADSAQKLQCINLNWKSGSFNVAELTEGIVGNDSMYDLYPQCAD